MRVENTDLTYIPITGRGVDAFEHRKEAGSPVEVTEEQMRESIQKVSARNARAFQQLRQAALTRC